MEQTKNSMFGDFASWVRRKTPAKNAAREFRMQQDLLIEVQLAHQQVSLQEPPQTEAQKMYAWEYDIPEEDEMPVLEMTRGHRVVVDKPM